MVLVRPDGLGGYCAVTSGTKAKAPTARLKSFMLTWFSEVETVELLETE